ncbi:MAG: hypothetical protein IT320_15785 [Anaerolineae bacterium]|nr:hypothetical protein [Anaerolineae bacterium]
MLSNSKWNSLRAAAVGLVAVASVTFAPVQALVAHAQDSMAVACDSTLVTLLIVAEHDYSYLTDMKAMSESSDAMMTEIDYGQYTPLVDEILARMSSMEGDMSGDEMMEGDDMMGMMSAQDTISAYFTDTGMDAPDFSMYSDLPAGDVAGEDAACTALRADVQAFLLEHVIADMQMSSMEG